MRLISANATTHEDQYADTEYALITLDRRLASKILRYMQLCASFGYVDELAFSDEEGVQFFSSTHAWNYAEVADKDLDEIFPEHLEYEQAPEDFHLEDDQLQSVDGCKMHVDDKHVWWTWYVGSCPAEMTTAWIPRHVIADGLGDTEDECECDGSGMFGFSHGVDLDGQGVDVGAGIDLLEHWPELIVVERCDLCWKYLSDEEAAEDNFETVVTARDREGFHHTLVDPMTYRFRGRERPYSREDLSVEGQQAFDERLRQGDLNGVLSMLKDLEEALDGEQEGGVDASEDAGYIPF